MAAGYFFMGDLPSADSYLALMAADLATWRLDCVTEVAYLSPLWASWVGLAIGRRRYLFAPLCSVAQLRPSR
jgi:hypothetical protein